MGFADGRAAGSSAIERAASLEKQPTGRGPVGCDENGPAAALLVGYVPHHFYSDWKEPNSGSRKMVRDAPSKCQSGSDRLAGGPF
jgi:hypothetical protein